MAHVILFSYILLFSTGFAGLSALAFLSIRTRAAVLPYLTALQAVFLAGLGIQAVLFYGDAVAPSGFRDAPLGTSLLEPVLGATGASLYVLAWLGLRKHGVFGKRAGGSDRALRTAASFFTLLTGVVMSIGTLLLALQIATGAPVARLVELPPPLGYVVPSLAMLFLALTLVRLRPSGTPSAVAFLLRWYGIALFTFLPLTALEALLEMNPRLPYAPLSLDYVFFLEWNVVAVVAFARSIVSSPETSTTLASVPSDAVARFGLSPREAEMVVLIARGLSNKQIAAELSVSEATVRTHIYNLFRKTGVGGRVELLNRIREF